jgi:predicted ATP-dependent endonuclease of OLD family
MSIKRICLNNITVFDELEIDFSKGINVLVGENGFGKTHIMKLLYAACQSSKKNISFSHKTVMVFRPDDYKIARLVNRDKQKDNTAVVKVYSDTSNIGITFSSKTKNWDADITNEDDWEKHMELVSSVYIPAKEILSNAWNLESAVKVGNVEFDDTYLDIIASAKVDVSRGKDDSERKKYLDMLQSINKGKVAVENERFYLKSGNQAKMEFNLVAEGMRKIALLWQLIKNGTLERGSVLFWDEPEANINPKYIPVLADILLELQREGVQIFIATHDYFLAKYIETRKKENDIVTYLSLYLREDTKQIAVEQNDSFAALEHNTILETFMELYHEEVRKAME